MNIAIFTNNYLPNPYGVSTSVEGFRRSLISMGHKVYIFAPQWGDESDKSEEGIFRYPAIKAPTKIDFSLVIPYSSKIDEVLEVLDIDIIHSQHPNLLGAVASRWAEKKDVPLVFTWHSLYDRYAHYTPFLPDKISGQWAMSNAAAFAEACDHVIVPTESIVKIVKDAGVTHDRISIVSSGVDEELFANANGDRLREKYNIDKNKTVLVTVSRLTEEKNVIFLARSIAQVLKNNSDVIFLCGGEGDLIDDMKEVFSSENVLQQVIFAGKLLREEVKNFLSAGDIFVYASTSETQGTIVTENMYIGLPIVAIGEKGVGDLIDDGISGVLVEENKNEFAKAVQKLIDNENDRKKMGENAYKIAREKYTTTICTKKLLNVYEEAIEYFNS